MSDPVNPMHYRVLGEYSAIHVAEKWDAPPHVTHALKYMQRAGMKEGESAVTDLKKAVWYLNRRIHLLDPNHPDPAAEPPPLTNAPSTAVKFCGQFSAHDAHTFAEGEDTFYCYGKYV